MNIAASTSPLVPLGEPAQVVTYPLSVEYVKAWSLPRALAEALSNAIDADPEHFTAHYDESTRELVIEDFASEGIGIESMVFGWSDKTGRDDVIGQFGEGLKIATIRAVSDPGVTHMVIESVGVTVVPSVNDYSTASSGLNIPVKSQQTPQVLAWNLYPSQRKVGTKVRVGVSPEVGQEVLSRFRHVTVPGYKPPTEPGVILADEPGRVYIGGVFVNEQPDLLFGYDLALSVAKRFQNRDRTVIDSYMLTYAISQVLQGVNDEDTLEALVRAALSGKITRSEQGFLPRGASRTAAQLRLWDSVAKRILTDPEHCFYRADESDAETAVNLGDSGFREIVSNGLDVYTFHALMAALGVKPAVKARARQSQQDVEWTRSVPVEVQERIDRAVSIMRTLYGVDAVGKVRVYETILNRSVIAHCEVQGFYSPHSGQIALSRSACENDETLWEVLFHETGHRIAHRGLLGTRTGEYHDRTRGFERVLGDMGVVLMKHLVAGRSLAEITSPKHAFPYGDRIGTSPSGRRWVFNSPTNYPVEESFLGDRVRAYVSLGFETWVTGRETPVRAGQVYTTYARENYVTAPRARRMALGLVGSKINYQIVKDICDPLPGVNAAVVWWATVGTLAMWMGRNERSRVRSFATAPRTEALRACADLAADPLYADLAPQLVALANGTSEVRPEWSDTAWTAPLDELMRRAEAQVDRDALRQVASRVSIPGDADPRIAWGQYLLAQA